MNRLAAKCDILLCGEVYPSISVLVYYEVLCEFKEYLPQLRADHIKILKVEKTLLDGVLVDLSENVLAHSREAVQQRILDREGRTNQATILGLM